MDEYCDDDRDVILDMGEAALDIKEPALHIPQQPQVDITAYSYYGDLSKRRYDLPMHESGDWQGRP